MKDVHESSEFLFISERSGQMTTRAIAYIVDVYLERCGLLQRKLDGTKIDGQHSCHSLRHTLCKNLIKAGWSIQTTMSYVEPSQDELKKRFNCFNDKAVCYTFCTKVKENDGSYEYLL